MRKKNILLSTKHGVNPSLQVCFYCGEDIGVLLLGRLPNDEKAPRKMCTDIEPCDKCKDKIGDNVILIEVNRKKNGLQVQDNLWANGTYWVVKKGVLNDDVTTKIGFVTHDDAVEMGLYNEH